MNNNENDPRRPYVRSMEEWWCKNPFFIRYMARELTAIGVAVYAFVMLSGLLSLLGGEATYACWLKIMSQPLSVVIHVFLLISMLYHTWSWFEIMPKTMPPMYSKGQRVPGKVITRTGLGVAVLTTALIFIIVWSVNP